jgi:large subunit ribosomal protein L10
LPGPFPPTPDEVAAALTGAAAGSGKEAHGEGGEGGCGRRANRAVPDLERRRSLGEQATFTVVKNTLTKIAATEAGIATELGGLLSGPSAIAFVSGDVVEAAKGLRDFAKANPALVIKGGVIDGKSMSPREIERLADLESREVLLAMLAGAMKASMANAAATMAALPTQMARLAGALAAKREAEQGPAQEAQEASAGEATQAEATQAEATQAEATQAEATQAEATQAEAETPNDEAVADAAAENDD